MAPRPPIQVKVVPQAEFDESRRNWNLAFFDANGDPIENMDGIPVPGPAGEDGAPQGLANSLGVEFVPRPVIMFENADITEDADPETGWTYINVRALGRRRTNSNIVYSSALAADADDELELETTNWAAWMLYKVLAGAKPLRARLYASSAHRTADLARPIGTDPTGDHGLFLEVVLDAAEELTLSPSVHAFSDEEITLVQQWDTKMYWTLTNLGTTGDTSLTVVYRGVEDPPPSGG